MWWADGGEIPAKCKMARVSLRLSAWAKLAAPSSPALLAFKQEKGGQKLTHFHLAKVKELPDKSSSVRVVCVAKVSASLVVPCAPTLLPCERKCDMCVTHRGMNEKQQEKLIQDTMSEVKDELYLKACARSAAPSSPRLLTGEPLG